MKVRTRFAPSPTGYIHVGNVRTALFTWILARQNQGSFIIRIEDTDQQRFVEGATDLIFETLKWLGLDWDEGPDVGGSYKPYVQSERQQIHLEWANKLVDKGLAYADPYTKEEIDYFRQQAIINKEPFLYRNHRPKNPQKWDGSKPLRFKVTNIKRYEWDDPIMGHLSAGPEALDDFILIKSDQMATYNFAHIIDDYDMKITHVVRGLEYVSSTPKYLSLYDALGIKPPVLICMPHIMAPGGKKKLGKRDGAKSVTQYRDEGILPEAMFNFLATLGWNDGTEKEVFKREEVLEKFDFSRVQKSGANFDEQKLIWLNGQWLRKLSTEELYKRAENYWPKSATGSLKDYKVRVLNLAKDRLKTLSDLPALSSYFFEEPDAKLALIKEDKNLSKLSSSELKGLLNKVIESLQDSEFDIDDIKKRMNNLLTETRQKPIVLFSLVRICTTWAPFSPDLFASLNILGKETTVSRLETAKKIFN